MTYTLFPMVEKMPASSILSVRVSPDEKIMIQHAAEQTRSTVAEFMRRKALEGAEEALMSRTVVTIPADQWEQFEAFLDEPPRDNPALRDLLSRRPSWQK